MNGAPAVRVVPRRAPLPLTAVGQLERELKFLVPESRVAFVRSWLSGVCAPDPAYPPARVVTVYFDTPALDLLDEKVNSDYLKTKVRARWYEPLAGGDVRGPVFVEAKSRVGSSRQKVRVAVDVAAAEASTWPLAARAWDDLVARLRLEGAEMPAALKPVVRLSYVRERLVDRLGGGRITLDTGITVDGVNPARVNAGLAGRVPGAVFEYKGSRSELPPHLGLLVRSGARRASFSKYLAAYLAATQTML